MDPLVIHEVIRFELSPRASAFRGKADTFPTDPMLIAAQWGGVGMLGVGRWGWKDRDGELHINTKAETADTLSFWAEGRNRRCAIAARAWYEWQDFPGRKKSEKKPKFRIAPPSAQVFWLLGIWRPHPDGMAEVSMLTRAAPESLAPFHERAVLPVLAEDAVRWTSSVDPIRDWAAGPAILPAEAQRA